MNVARTIGFMSRNDKHEIETYAAITTASDWDDGKIHDFAESLARFTKKLGLRGEVHVDTVERDEKGRVVFTATRRYYQPE